MGDDLVGPEALELPRAADEISSGDVDIARQGHEDRNGPHGLGAVDVLGPRSQAGLEAGRLGPGEEPGAASIICSLGTQVIASTRSGVNSATCRFKSSKPWHQRSTKDLR